MPARITIYCKQLDADAVARELASMLSAVDWHVAAEYEGVDGDAAVDDALAHFALLASDESWLVLAYRDRTLRQLTIDRLSTNDGAEKWIEETLHKVPFDGTIGVQTIRQHLGKCSDLVQIEAGYLDFVGLVPIFAHQTARCIAELADGLIEDQDSRWWKPEGAFFSEIYSPRPPSN